MHCNVYVLCCGRGTFRVCTYVAYVYISLVGVDVLSRVCVCVLADMRYRRDLTHEPMMIFVKHTKVANRCDHKFMS